MTAALLLLLACICAENIPLMCTLVLAAGVCKLLHFCKEKAAFRGANSENGMTSRRG